MRRYAVRFLVAVLTFGFGVALSLAFGLFRVQETRTGVLQFREFRHSSRCREKFRVSRPAFLNVDSQSADPLGLVYLGTTQGITNGGQVRMRFAVGNRSEKTISGYWLSTSDIWKTEGTPESRDFDWTAFEILEPGATNTILLPRQVEGSSLRVVKVTFRDGSTWHNPRVSE